MAAVAAPGSVWPPASPAHVALLLTALRSPAGCASIDAPGWDVLIRTARRARLLGTLAARLETERQVQPPPVAERLLEAARVEARFRQQKMRHLLDTVAPLLMRNAGCAVVLKGAAYVLQQRELAAGRLPADVDVLVPQADLPAVEAALADAGWQFEALEPYDERYYRRWSHELPPMRCAGQALELDLHHAILAPFGAARPAVVRLLESSVVIAGHPYRAFDIVDQAIHVAAHLFHDGDCVNRLRDLIDFEALLRDAIHSRGADGALEELVDRARDFGLARALAYTATFTAAWMHCADSARLAQRLIDVRRGAGARAVIALAARALPPPHPDEMPRGSLRWLPGTLLSGRSLWLRMPPGRVVHHTAVKALRWLRVAVMPNADAPS